MRDDDRRRARRGFAGRCGLLGLALALGLGGLLTPAAADDPASSGPSGDDYPYAGVGHCPLVPLTEHQLQVLENWREHKHEIVVENRQPGKHPRKPLPERPTFDRACARRVWFVDGRLGDPWGFALRNCTSFVAWRLREVNGLADFENRMSGGHWGDAKHWDENARALGYRVDRVPAIGAIAQTDHGSLGHVAWVAEIGPDTVTIEEYNHGVAGGYGLRTVPTSDFRYLHVADRAPSPYLGSTRSAVRTRDAHGGTWSARTTAHGDLLVRAPGRPERRLGARGAWSPTAAPALVLDGADRVRVAAVTRHGRLLSAVARGRGWSRLRVALPGRYAATSSPAYAVDGAGRTWLLATTPAGTLLTRHTWDRRGLRWTRPLRLGRPGVWGTHTAPAVTTGADGLIRFAGVDRSGRLLSARSTRGLGRWSALRRVDGRHWSMTSTPALVTGPDGVMHLQAINARGELWTLSAGRDGRWRTTRRLAGDWSVYSSPAVSTDLTGRLWLAAVDDDGRLVVRGTAPYGHRWLQPRVVARHRPVTMSPSLTPTVTGGISVSARTSLGEHARPASGPGRVGVSG